MKIPQASALALLLCAVSACDPATRPAASKNPATTNPTTTNPADTNAASTNPKTAPADTSGSSDANTAQATPKAHSAQLVERPRAGRAANILDAKGTVIATLVPEDFSQVLSVPDIANNTSEMINQRVSGTDVVAVSVEDGTGRILLGVRGFIYAEVSTDLVFLLQQRDEKAPAPSGPASSAWAILPVYFDGPSAPDQKGGVRPHLDVTRVSFKEGGRLVIETSDASGGSSELVYDANRTPQSCSWSAGESRRCPSGLSPQ